MRRASSPILPAACLAVHIAARELALAGLPPPGQAATGGPPALALHFNRGVAFSLFKSHPAAAYLLALVGVLLLAVLYFKAPPPRRSRAWGLLFAGAAGNLLDRLTYGHVVDWLRLGPVHVNAADLLLCAGGALLAIELLARNE